MEYVQGFFGWLFDLLAGMFDTLAGFLTYNPLVGLGDPVNDALLRTVSFVDRFIPASQMFRAVASALPWFGLLVVAGMLWRWFKGL